MALFDFAYSSSIKVTVEEPTGDLHPRGLIVLDITSNDGIEYQTIHIEVKVDSTEYVAFADGVFHAPFDGAESQASPITGGFRVILDYTSEYSVGGSVRLKCRAMTPPQGKYIKADRIRDGSESAACTSLPDRVYVGAAYESYIDGQHEIRRVALVDTKPAQSSLDVVDDEGSATSINLTSVWDTRFAVNRDAIYYLDGMGSAGALKAVDYSGGAVASTTVASNCTKGTVCTTESYVFVAYYTTTTNKWYVKRFTPHLSYKAMVNITDDTTIDTLVGICEFIGGADEGVLITGLDSGGNLVAYIWSTGATGLSTVTLTPIPTGVTKPILQVSKSNCLVNHSVSGIPVIRVFKISGDVPNVEISDTGEYYQSIPGFPAVCTAQNEAAIGTSLKTWATVCRTDTPYSSPLRGFVCAYEGSDAAGNVITWSDIFNERDPLLYVTTFSVSDTAFTYSVPATVEMLVTTSHSTSVPATVSVDPPDRASWTLAVPASVTVITREYEKFLLAEAVVTTAAEPVVHDGRKLGGDHYTDVPARVNRAYDRPLVCFAADAYLVFYDEDEIERTEVEAALERLFVGVDTVVRSAQ